MRVLLFAASLRKESVNKKLANLCKTLINTKCEVDHAEFHEFNVPLYDGDIEATQGIPDGAKHLIQRMQQTDGIIISSPEYNYSMPGTLKNLIDWVSRENPMPWRGKKIFLMSASPALAGGNRGLWNTRIPLEACGAFVYPEMFSLSNAYNAFTTNGQLQDSNLQNRLKDNLQQFLVYIKK